MPQLLPVLASFAVLTAVWAISRAADAHRLESSLRILGRTSRHRETASMQGELERRTAPGGAALLERLGILVMSTRAGAALGRRITAAHPSVPPAIGVAVVLLAPAAGVAVSFLLGHPDAAVLGPPLGLALAEVLARRWESRRIQAIERQLPDALTLQAGALRAGYSVAGSLESAGRACGPPLGPELTRSATALGLGVPLDEALGELARRCGARAVQPWIAALLAARSSGGDVSRTLVSFAARARERGQLHSELRALTAQGRLSGTVVSLAPVAFLALTAASSRGDAQALYGTQASLAVLASGAVLDVVGLLWIRRIAGVRA